MEDEKRIGLQGRRGTKTDSKETETQKLIARKKKHENGLQGRRDTKTYCKEGRARNYIASKNGRDEMFLWNRFASHQKIKKQQE